MAHIVQTICVIALGVILLTWLINTTREILADLCGESVEKPNNQKSKQL